MIGGSSPDNSSERYFVLHTYPDGDAIAASWLGMRMLFPLLFPKDVLKPRFVPFNQIDPTILAGATAVFDIGGEFNPQRLRFDHHQIEHPRASCATRMVWEYLTQGTNDQPPFCPDLLYLQPLVELIEAGDTGELDARGFTMSAILGPHALFAGFRALREEAILRQHPDLDVASEIEFVNALDYEVLHYGWNLLDVLARHLQSHYNITAFLHQRVIYMSKDQLVWGLRDSSYASVKAAFVAGARLVLTSSISRLPKSYTIEIWAMRSNLRSHVSDLIQQAAQEALQQGDEAMYQELKLFYCEETYAARGSPKASNPIPPRIDIVALIGILDRLWLR